MRGAGYWVVGSVLLVTDKSTSVMRVTVRVLKALTSGVLCSMLLTVKLPTHVFNGSNLRRRARIQGSQTFV